MLSLSLSYEGHRVRMAGTPERPEWVAKDLCRILGLTTHNAGQGIPEDEKGHCDVVTPGGPQGVVTVKEAGLYRLIARSHTPAAQRFQAWLFGEVLPSIRKFGQYPPPAETPALPGIDVRDIRQLAPLALQLVNLVQEQQAQIAVLTPKAEAHDRLSEARGDCSLTDAGRRLGRQPRALMAQLEADQILFRGSDGRHRPAHEYRERGLFRVRTIEAEGRSCVQTLVTPAGLCWLAGKYQPTDKAGSTQIQVR
jgi:prophage antirepressor-like protein